MYVSALRIGMRAILKGRKLFQDTCFAGCEFARGGYEHFIVFCHVPYGRTFNHGWMDYSGVYLLCIEKRGALG